MMTIAQLKTEYIKMDCVMDYVVQWLGRFENGLYHIDSKLANDYYEGLYYIEYWNARSGYESGTGLYNQFIADVIAS